MIVIHVYMFQKVRFHIGELYIFIVICGFFLRKKDFSSETSFINTIRMSNRLDPHQDRRFVGPDLGSNCLQRLSINIRQMLTSRFKGLK